MRKLTRSVGSVCPTEDESTTLCRQHDHVVVERVGGEQEDDRAGVERTTESVSGLLSEFAQLTSSGESIKRGSVSLDCFR
jgi:hypothetical protein